MRRVEPQPYFGGLASRATLPADIDAISSLNLANRARPQPILPADACRIVCPTAVATVAREDSNG